MSKSRAKEVVHSEDDYHYFNGNHRVLDKPIDRFCIALLDELSTAGGTVWRPTIILKFKDIFEEQQYYIATYSLRHKSTLSTSILIRIIQALISNDFFIYSTSTTHFDLELHLRCIVAALRLLSVHGIDRGSGTLNFATWEGLYKRMPKWQEYHNGQVLSSKRTEDKIKNYNNEFLIVYAQDLLTTMPNDRTIAANLTTRAVATAAALGHAYSKNVVETFNALKLALDYKLSPSTWHAKFRSMDDLCLAVRTVRHYYNQSQKLQEGEKLKSEFPDLLDDTELSIVDGLMEILKEELKSGLGSTKGRNTVRAGLDALTMNPLSRGNHLIYGTLDIIQQHVPAINNGKIDGKVVEIALEVARHSRYSFLRCKAFEVLAVMRNKFNGMVKEKVNDLLEDRSLWPSLELRGKAIEQWKVTRNRVKTMEKILKELRDEAPDVDISSVPGPVKTHLKSELMVIGSAYTQQTVPIKHLEDILGHLESVEDSLICPCETEDDPDSDLSKLPCGHTISLRAWKKYESACRERHAASNIPCPRCKAPVLEIGKVLPMKGVRRAIGEIKENCLWLKGQLPWDGPTEDDGPFAENGYDDLLEEEEEPVNSILGSVPNSDSIVPSTMVSSSSSWPAREKDTLDLDYSKARGSTDRDVSQTQSPLARTATPEKGTCAAVRAIIPPTLNIATVIGEDKQQGTILRSRTNSSSTLEMQTASPATPRQRNLSPKSPKSTHAPTITKDTMFSPTQTSDVRQRTNSLNVEHIPSLNREARRDSSSTKLTPRASIVSAISTSSCDTATKRNSHDSTSSIFSRAGSVRSIIQSFNVKSSVVVELGQTGKVFEDNAISPSGDKLALIDKTSFVVLSVPDQSEELWYPDNFTRLCCGFNDGRYGKKVAKAHFTRTVIPTYSRTVLSDRSLFIACIEGFVDVHEISTGKRLGKILFTQGRRCWNMAISPNGEILAIALDSGEVLLYPEGEDNGFSGVPMSAFTDPGSVDLRLLNCLTFSPDSLHLATCTSDNITRTYSVDMSSHQVTFVQSYNRQLDDKACKDPYYGVTDIAFSSHSSSLLVVSYAKKAYPILVGNIVLPGKELKITPMGEMYKDTNCRVAYSPISSAALLVTRTGTVKLVNCAMKGRKWTVVDLSKEKMDDMKPWRYCSLGFSKDGYRGLALDRRAKLLVVEFSAGRSDTI